MASGVTLRERKIQRDPPEYVRAMPTSARRHGGQTRRESEALATATRERHARAKVAAGRPGRESNAEEPTFSWAGVVAASQKKSA